MENLIGRKVKGFRFESCKYGDIRFPIDMEKHINKKGVIKVYNEHNNSFKVEFKNGQSYCYPAELIEQYLINENMKERKLSDLNAGEKKIAVLALREYCKDDSFEYDTSSYQLGSHDHINTFIKHHNLEPIKIEVGRVYKVVKGSDEYLFMHQKDGKSYGFSKGKWINHAWYTEGNWGKYAVITEATDKEWFEALDRERVKLGLVEGVEFKNVATYNLGTIYTLEGSNFRHGYSEDSLDEVNSNGLIFKNGVWATIIDPKQEVKDQIEKMEAELKRLKKLV